MKFRAIDIPKVVYQILRSNYAIRRDMRNGAPVLSLNNLYKFIVCCLYDIKTYFGAYDTERRRNYMIASCMPIQGQGTFVLNHLYGEHGVIEIGQPSFQSIYFYDRDSSTSANQIYMYTDDQNKPVYLGYEGASANTFIVTIPQALADDAEMYSDFVATLNSIVMYGLKYEIQIR
jgi:hypothetical protein